MATYALIGTLSFNTVAKRDNVYNAIQTFLSGKPIWGNTTMTKMTDFETGNPAISIEVRFTQRPNLDNAFNLLKTQANALTGVKAVFHKHVCHHDEGTQPCVIEELATIVR